MAKVHDLVVSVVEPSGDRLAAEVLAELRTRVDVRVRGVAGPQLRAAGVETLVPMEDLQVMGIAEVLRHLRTIKAARRTVANALSGASLLLVVDGPDFHLPLGRQARAKGIDVVGLVCPQVWAWRPGRVHAISEALDSLLCLFDFEPALFANVSNPDFETCWVGHPVVDRVPVRTELEPDVYALLPGSRPQEISRHLGVFLEAADEIRRQKPDARFRLVAPEALDLGTSGLPAHVERVSDLAAISGVRSALTKSGTVTLELAAIGIPQVVAHRVHPITYWLGRLLVRGVKHIALPNVLAERSDGPFVPEFVQRLEPSRLADEVLSLPDRQPTALTALGQGGAAARAADALARRLLA